MRALVSAFMSGLSLRARETVEWETPADFMELMVARYGKFTLDPAASVHNHQTKRFFTEHDDGLTQRWRSKNVWLNPPYGRGSIGPWIRAAINQVHHTRNAKQVIMLLPARTDAPWFHNEVWTWAREVAFVRGRIHFVGGEHGATFPSIVVQFCQDDNEAMPLFTSIGRRKP